MAILQSIQVGLPRQLGTAGSDDPDRQPWFSGFVKQGVAGPVEVRVLGLAGDGQADLKNHGGPDKAILCYNGSRFAAWAREFERPNFTGGTFGENWTLDDLDEEQVCIGDTYSVGADVTVQVTQPRQPCWKLGRRCEEPALPKRVVQTGFCGWYLRVLTPGWVESGQSFRLLERANPSWTVRRAHRLMYAKETDPHELSQLASVPELSRSWNEELTRKANL